MMKLLPTRLTLRLHLAAVLFAALVGHGHAQNPLTNGLVARWKLDGNANDALGVSPGIAQNIQWVTQTVGATPKTVAFLGGGGGVGGLSVAKTTALNLPATGYTIMGWVKSTNFSATTPPNTYFTLIGSQGINGQQEDAFGVGYGPQGLSFQTSGLDNYPSFDPGYRGFKFVKTTDFASDVLQPDKWHFVAVTYDGTAFRGFVDGVQLTALTSSTSWDALAPKSTDRTTGIGMRNGGVTGGYDPANNGYISDVRLYNRGLTTSEVGQIYASESSFGVGLNLFPVFTIVGAVGSACRIEVTSDLVNTNVWTTLTNLTLPSSPYDFIDKSTPQPLRRFYRAVPLP